MTGGLLTRPGVGEPRPGHDRSLIEKGVSFSSRPLVLTGLGAGVEVVASDIAFDGGVVRPVGGMPTVPRSLSYTLPFLSADVFGNMLRTAGLLPGLDNRTGITVLKGHVLLGGFPAYTPLLKGDQIRELLKKAYIGYRAKKYDKKEKKDVADHMVSEKKEYLYANAKSQRHFLLSLMGESVTLDKKYVETLEAQSGIELETILKFVELPYWKPKSLQQNEPRAYPTRAGPYPALFSWLSERRVNKIFEVKVDDDGPEPHTDAAILEALRGKGATGKPPRNFEVEI
ncbi:hypothetical protein MAPG_03834 [Magnaporthiopsis poae ATCC 64411]|uniref:Uncharacterized protein n=1 Tax=Magnaporthiopsis poae (strain ATCC 64411 / 73-15) TaxID=644358 RepID=A0A0C4DV34_MAGP6|nr:hypothetical protein MAPG_03834 [Magnaporthiopsis poae ATCC 64411]